MALCVYSMMTPQSGLFGNSGLGILRPKSMKTRESENREYVCDIEYVISEKDAMWMYLTPFNIVSNSEGQLFVIKTVAELTKWAPFALNMIFGVSSTKILLSIGQTIYMVGLSLIFGLVLAFPLAILLFVTRKGGIKQNLVVYNIVGTIINIIRSVPFIILIFLCIHIVYIKIYFFSFFFSSSQ